MQTQIRTRLLDDSPVAAIAGTRINWGARPQGEAYPSIVLTLISDARPQNFKANIDSRFSVVQIDCYGATAAQATALREAVISAIVPPATVGGVIFDRAFIDMVRNLNSHTETGIVYRDVIEARVWHRSN